jgi:hypothetical protein
MGAVVGLGTFFVAFPPWPLGSVRWERTLRLFAAWEGASLLWGVACGVAFGLCMMALERTRRVGQVSAEPAAAAPGCHAV